MTTFASSVAELEQLADNTDDALGLDWGTALLGQTEADIRAMFEELARSSAAERIRSVSLRNNDLDGPLVPSLLVEAPFASQLEQLVLRDNCLSTESMQVLAACDRLEALEVVDMSGNWFGEDAIKALARASWLGSLRSLDLGVNWVNADAVRALVAGDEPLKLEFLTLGPCMAPIGDEGAEAIAHSDNLLELDQLVLTNAGIGDDGLAEICENMELRFLTLTNKEGVWYADTESRGRNEITDRGVRTLAHSTMAAGLLELFLDGNPIGAQAREELLGSLSPDCDCDLR